MNKREIEILKIGFEAGKKAIEMHPDDDEYDTIRFEEAQERVKNLCIANVMPSLELLKFKEMRKSKGLTLMQVEEVTGVSNGYLSQLENKKIKAPSYNIVRKLYMLYNGA